MEKLIQQTGFEPILEKIFKHLDSATLMSCLSVCKYWNQVVQNPSFLLMWSKLAKMPENILSKWKDLAIKLQDKVDLTYDFSKCLLWISNIHENNGFLFPETVASALGLVSLLKFIASYTNIDFSGEADNGSSPLHYAAEKGHVEALKFLGTLTKNVVTENKDEMTPIHFGVMSGKVEIMKYFHDLGYDLDIPIYQNHYTPFFLAVYHQKLEVIRYLAALLENPLSKLLFGLTPFHLAAHFGLYESLTCL